MNFLRFWLPTFASFCLTPIAPLHAPQIHTACIDERPAIVRALAVAISRHERCPGNVGCLQYHYQSGAHRGRGRYARWDTEAESFAALVKHIERRMTWSIEEILSAYNPSNPRYIEIVLAGTDLDGATVIAEMTTCGGER